MRSKVIESNNNLAVTLPSELIDRWNLEPGSELNIQVDEEHGVVLITPANLETAIDPELDAIIDEVIEEYRPALESLAQR